MARKKVEEVPQQKRFDHGEPFIGPTTAQPISMPDGKAHVVPVPCRSRFNEFKYESEKKGGE